MNINEAYLHGAYSLGYEHGKGNYPKMECKNLNKEEKAEYERGYKEGKKSYA